MNHSNEMGGAQRGDIEWRGCIRARIRTTLTVTVQWKTTLTVTVQWKTTPTLHLASNHHYLESKYYYRQVIQPMEAKSATHAPPPPTSIPFRTIGNNTACMKTTLELYTIKRIQNLSHSRALIWQVQSILISIESAVMFQ